MFRCHVCGSNEARNELVSEVFTIEGKPVLVENIPSTVCARCGEPVFSRETTEKVRRMKPSPCGRCHSRFLRSARLGIKSPLRRS